MRQDLFTGKKWNFILIVLFVLSIVASITKIWIGFDIDEAYAVSMPFRLLQGDHLFRDMWEVHQTSALFPAVIERVYVAVHGSVDGLVIFLRCIATLIHLLISILVMLVLFRQLGIGSAMMVALLYYNFLPKWMISIDFSMQLIWLMTLSIICLYYAVTVDVAFWNILSSIFFACSVLAYPGMILAYPFYLVALIRLCPSAQDLMEKIYKCVVFTSGCAMCAAVFIVYVLMYVPFDAFMQSIPMIFMDGSHQFTLSMKLMLYAKQWILVGIHSMILIVPTVLLAYALHRMFEWKFNLELNLCVFLWLSSGMVLVANLFGIAWSPFRLQIRYLVLFLIGILFLVNSRFNRLRWEKDVLWTLIIPSIGMFVGVLVASNVGPESSASYLVVGCIASVIIYIKRIESDYYEARKIEHAKLWHAFTKLSIVLFVLSLILCKGYYVRTTEYVPSNIIAKRLQVKEGALKGIWLLPEDHKRITEDDAYIKAHISAEDEVLFMGTESQNNLVCVNIGARFVSPTTISTPAFNEQWVNYFEQNPQHMPDKIFLAKNTIDNREKFFAKNPFGIWIASHYNISEMQETESLCLIQK